MIKDDGGPHRIIKGLITKRLIIKNFIILGPIHFNDPNLESFTCHRLLERTGNWFSSFDGTKVKQKPRLPSRYMFFLASIWGDPTTLS